VNSTKKMAKLAGLLYFVTSIFGAFSLLYIPSTFIVSGNAAATASKILDGEKLFRLGILSEVIGFTGFIFVVGALYLLFRGVDKTQAGAMFVLMVMSIPISLVSVVNEIAALMLVRGGDFLSALDQPQREALAMLFLRMHGQGAVVAQFFWGLWLIPFGILVYRSGFLPRILGVLLVIACFGYLTDSLVALRLLPEVFGRVLGKLTLAELPIILWLLIVGAKDQPLRQPA
jgi:hypothetical protein